MRIAIIGASGYGNVGDDTYPIIFKKHLTKFHELTFFNSDAAARKEVLPRFDYMIFGGGGIIYNSQGSTKTNGDKTKLSAHFSYMKYYLDHALRNNIPYCFCSADIQVRKDRISGKWNYKPLTPWIPFLQKADFISVRSSHSAKVLSEMYNRKVHFFPDLAYLFRTEQGQYNREKFMLYIPAGKINTANKKVQNLIREYTSKGYKVKAMTMGAYLDNKNDLDDFKLRHPDAEVIYKSTPALALKMIENAKFVITGRYHGMVFSRIAGKHFYVGDEKSKYKIAVEDLHSDSSAAIRHIKLLKDHLRKNPC